MLDDKVINAVINACDSLDITRVSEYVNGEWKVTTIFSSDEALFRVIGEAIKASKVTK